MQEVTDKEKFGDVKMVALGWLGFFMVNMSVYGIARTVVDNDPRIFLAFAGVLMLFGLRFMIDSRTYNYKWDEDA